jgi:hypothetical protein
MGAETLLRELGLEQVVDPKAADIIMWPGGNPTMWQGNLDRWQDCWRKWPKTEFVVAPATFQNGGLDWRAVLKTAGENLCGLFSRDPVSHRNLSQLRLATGVTTGLGHDPAFHLKDTEWVARHREAGTSEYVLASFRGDHESSMAKRNGSLFQRTLPAIVRRRWDFRERTRCMENRVKQVRAQSPGQVINVCDAPSMSFESFVECVRGASQVHTDRLHCMILALFLGKEVFAYPTAYGKLESVYEHSIKDWARAHFVKCDT